MTVANNNENEKTNVVGVTTKTKNFDREESVRTLPNDENGYPSQRSVMSAAPPPTGGGPRSGGALVEESAGGVASDVDAVAAASGAVSIAACEAPRRAKLAGVAAQSTAMRNAIEAVFGSEGRGPLTKDFAIEAAKTMLNVIEEARNVRKDTKPQPSTIYDYQGRQLLVDEAMDDIEGPYAHRLKVAMGGWSANRQTFNKMRAALQYRAVDLVRSSLAAVLSPVYEQDLEVVKALRRETLKLALVLLLNQQDCLDAVGGVARKPVSKKRLLKKLPVTWREDFLDAVADSETYAMPCALLNACGLRPIELEKGVLMSMIDDRVHIRINGGKVRPIAGQPWRQFSLESSALPSWAYDSVRQAGELNVTADPDALRSYIGRVSAKLHPRHEPPRSSDILLSAYVFRHALVSDLRADGWDTADIAGVIGETSAQTVKWYGLNWGTGGRRSQKARAASIVKGTVETARPVRAASTVGLVKLKEATKKSRVGLKRRQ